MPNEGDENLPNATGRLVYVPLALATKRAAGEPAHNNSSGLCQKVLTPLAFTVRPQR